MRKKKDAQTPEEPEQDEKQDAGNFSAQGMVIGMLFGISVGMALAPSLGMSIGTGMCLGMSTGMCLGLAVGSGVRRKK